MRNLQSSFSESRMCTYECCAFVRSPALGLLRFAFLVCVARELKVFVVGREACILSQLSVANAYKKRRNICSKLYGDNKKLAVKLAFKMYAPERKIVHCNTHWQSCSWRMKTEAYQNNVAREGVVVNYDFSVHACANCQNR